MTENRPAREVSCGLNVEPEVALRGSNNEETKKEMKIKTLQLLALVASLAIPGAAHADLVTYDWVQGTINYPGNDGTQAITSSTGTLTFDTSTKAITQYSFSWSVDGGTIQTDISYNGTGSTTVWSDGDLYLSGGNAQPSDSSWGYGTANRPNEAEFFLANGDNTHIDGDWVVAPVPEPSTMISAGLMLLPFGASCLRIVRRSRTA